MSLNVHNVNLTAVLLATWHPVLARLSGQHLPVQFPKQMTIQQGGGLVYYSCCSLAFCPIPGLVVPQSLLLPGLGLGSSHHRPCSSLMFSFLSQGPWPPVRQHGHQEERHHGQCSAHRAGWRQMLTIPRVTALLHREQFVPIPHLNKPLQLHR